MELLSDDNNGVPIDLQSDAVTDDPAAAFRDAASSGRLKRRLERIRSAPTTSWVTFAVVTLAAGLVFWRLHPSKILMDSTPAGGDMGAHVWGPAYLRDNLLSNGSLRGWTMDWYGGFPALHFYMILPYLLIVIVDVVLPYGIAFKLIAVAGVVTIPISSYVLGRMARLPYPAPALMSVAGLLYVFEFNFTIYGGNIASTLAGEFAFSLSLSFALLFLAFFIRGIDEGTHRVWAAVFLAATATSHLIPLAFAVATAVAIVVVRSYHRLPRLVGVGQTALLSAAAVASVVATFNTTQSALPRLIAIAIVLTLLLVLDLKRSWFALTAGVGGILLSGFWLFPFVARRSYLNDMGWEKLTQVRQNLFSPEQLGGGTHLETTWLLGLAGLGAIAGVVFWNRMAMTWTVVAFASAMAFVHWPQDRLWNARFLGFWYLGLYMLAACGVWLVGRAVGKELERAWAHHPQGKSAHRYAVLAMPLLVFVLGYGYTSLHLGLLPGGNSTEDGGYAWGPLRVSSDDRNFVSGWANWNFSGYERKPAYPEYFNLITTMDNVGADHGCGRAMWEFGRDHLDRYGTPMAPMLLPHWTDGCIQSMEGLYFESTASVAQHFLVQSELSQDPSRPMRDLPYSDFDIDSGIDHMRLSGVKYYMAFSDTAIREAATRPDDLIPIAQSDGWTVYDVVGTTLVDSLQFEPVVVDGISHAGRGWTDPSVAWFNDAEARQVLLVDDGPSSWARVGLISGSEPLTAEPAPRHEIEPIVVSNVVLEDDRISFSVDQIGVPVLIKVSYFPNWTVATGADDIYRSTPNYMVVVPTDTDVVLEYKDTAVEYAGYGMTLAGVVMLWGLSRFDPFARRNDDDDPDPAFWDRDIDYESGNAIGGDASVDILGTAFMPIETLVQPAVEPVAEPSIQPDEAAVHPSTADDVANNAGYVNESNPFEARQDNDVDGDSDDDAGVDNDAADPPQVT